MTIAMKSFTPADPALPPDPASPPEHVFAPDLADPRSLRNALGTYATGVTVVTAIGADGPAGRTANSFASVSLDPPLILWSSSNNSRRHDLFVTTGHFAVHVLAAEQEHLSARFTRGGAGFDGIEWTANEHGVPILAGTLARFECARHAVHDGGDHTIVVGRILRVAHRDGDPLCLARGRYGRFVRSV